MLLNFVENSWIAGSSTVKPIETMKLIIPFAALAVLLVDGFTSAGAETPAPSP